MNTNHYTDHDYDACDAPAGTDPLIREERGRTWFRHEGCWWAVGTLPPEARREYLAEMARRDRAQKARGVPFTTDCK